MIGLHQELNNNKYTKNQQQQFLVLAMLSISARPPACLP
jgi:hypothetical protein